MNPLTWILFEITCIPLVIVIVIKVAEECADPENLALVGQVYEWLAAELVLRSVCVLAFVVLGATIVRWIWPRIVNPDPDPGIILLNLEILAWIIIGMTPHLFTKLFYPDITHLFVTSVWHWLQWLVFQPVMLRIACALALVAVGARISRRVIRSLQRTRYLDRFDFDKRILWSQLPEVVWRQVFRSRETTLERSTEASSVFGILGLRSGYLALRRGNTLPPISREWNVAQDPKSGPTALLSSLVSLKTPITTLLLDIHRDFRPDGEALYSFLALQTDTLRRLSISCLESCYVSPCLQLKLPTLRHVRVLEIRRSVTYVCKSVVFLEPLDTLFPDLESVTLSHWGWEDWSDLFAGFPVCDTVTHVRIVSDAHSRRLFPLFHAADVFPEVESLEIPCVPYLVVELHDWFGSSQLKRLTLTCVRNLPTNHHSLDQFLTFYSQRVCAAILKSPDKDPEQVHREYTEGNNPGWAERRAEEIQDTFWNLEELQIRCGKNYGPTAVCVPDLLRMPSLRTLDFGGSSNRIPEQMMRQLRDRFTVKL